MDGTVIVVAAISAAATLVLGILTFRFYGKAQNAQSNGNAAYSIAQAAAEIAETSREDVKDLRQQLETMEQNLIYARNELATMRYQQTANVTRIAELENRVKELKAGIEILTNQLKNLGYDPAWIPPSTRPLTPQDKP